MWHSMLYRLTVRLVEMSQATELVDVHFEQVGPADTLVSAFLHPVTDLAPVIPSMDETLSVDPKWPSKFSLLTSEVGLGTCQNRYRRFLAYLIEATPHDLFWGGGQDGEGLNYLLMK